MRIFITIFVLSITFANGHENRGYSPYKVSNERKFEEDTDTSSVFVIIESFTDNPYMDDGGQYPILSRMAKIDYNKASEYNLDSLYFVSDTFYIIGSDSNPGSQLNILTSSRIHARIISEQYTENKKLVKCLNRYNGKQKPIGRIKYSLAKLSLGYSHLERSYISSEPFLNKQFKRKGDSLFIIRDVKVLRYTLQKG